MSWARIFTLTVPLSTPVTHRCSVVKKKQYLGARLANTISGLDIFDDAETIVDFEICEKCLLCLNFHY